MKHNRRQGTSATVVALTSTMMFGMGAIVIDLGYARLVKAELQTASDAASLAAVRRLDGTAAGLTRARAAAVNMASMNLASLTPVVVNANPDNDLSGDVISGHWTEAGFAPTSDASQVNAIRVRPRRHGLAAALGVVGFDRDSFDVAARAVALQGARSGAAEVGYYLPFGLPRCQLDALPKDQLASITFVLNPAGTDNTGWGLLGLATSASAIKEHLLAIDSCMRTYDQDGFLEDTCVAGKVTDPLNLANGVAESALATLATAVSTGVPWNTAFWGPVPPQHSSSAIAPADYGHTLAGPIPVFEGGPAYCSATGSWNETLPIAGFVWGSIYDVRTTGAAASRNLWLRLDPSTFRQIGTKKGGGDYGIVWVGPSRVVQ